MGVPVNAQTCPYCGSPFVPLRGRGGKRLYCYSKDCFAARERERTKIYSASLPKEERQRRRHECYVKSGGAAQKKYATLTCVGCGAVRHRSDVRARARTSFLCGECKRPKPIPSTCKTCGAETAARRRYCDRCRGGLAEVGRTLGLSREWVRRLVQREMDKGVLPRDEAVKAVLRQRGAA